MRWSFWPRRAFATLALQNGIDVKTVSTMLGYYGAGFTLRTYTHATRRSQGAAEKMSAFMAQVMPMSVSACCKKHTLQTVCGSL